MADERRDEAVTGVAASLLAELEAGGEFVDAGEFSIDGAQARTKLRQYLLADAHAYVLLLIEAAVLAGAAPVAVEIDGGEVRVDIGPVSFVREELEQLFAAVFVELDEVEGKERSRRRVLQKLALACNSALSLGPEQLRLETRVGAEGLRLRLRPDQDTAELEVLDEEGLAVLAAAAGQCEVPPEAWTRLTVDFGLLSQERGAARREAELIRSRCCYSPWPIELDGERVSWGFAGYLRRGYGSPRKVRRVVVEGQNIGAAGMCYGGQSPAELVILVNGVEAERRLLEEEDRSGAFYFGAIVDLELPRDLGQERLLRGSEYAKVLDAVWAVHDAIAPEDREGPELGVASLPHDPAAAEDSQTPRGSPVVALVLTTSVGLFLIFSDLGEVAVAAGLTLVALVVVLALVRYFPAGKVGS